MTALALTVIACGSRAGTTVHSALPAVLATVNDQPIPTKLFDMYLKNGSAALELDPDTDEGRRKLEQLREGIVSELIDRTLISQEAQRRGLVVAEDRMSAAEQRAIAELGGDERYSAYLAEHRMTRDEYREVIKLQVFGEMMRQELSKDLVVPDNQVRAYYETRKDDLAFQQPERVTASHILIAARTNLISQQIQREKQLAGIPLTDAVRDELERRRERAEELRRQVLSGADFAALARQHSEDPGTRLEGGALGSFVRGSHTAAFDEAAFKLRPGGISEVVQTEYGFHIIKVFAREPARRQTLAEATPEIRQRLLSEREAQVLSEWLKDVRSKASIRINEPFRFGALRDEFLLKLDRE